MLTQERLLVFYKKMELNTKMPVDYQEVSDLEIGNLVKESIIIIMIMPLLNITFINGNHQMIAAITHVEVITFQQITLDS